MGRDGGAERVGARRVARLGGEEVARGRPPPALAEIGPVEEADRHRQRAGARRVGAQQRVADPVGVVGEEVRQGAFPSHGSVSV